MAGGRNISLGKNAQRGDGTALGGSRKTIMYIGQVRAIDEEYASNRVKVYIHELDFKKSGYSAENPKKKKAELPWATPLLPLHLNIVPKVGEWVKVLLRDPKNGEVGREYIGPIIPQNGKYLREAKGLDFQKGMKDSNIPFDKSIKFIPTAKDGLYPKEDDIAIQGRDNTDIIFKSSEVLIRAHKFRTDSPEQKNIINPAYLNIRTLSDVGSELEKSQIDASKGYEKISRATTKNNQTRTDINLVSNKIYLIGRDSNSSLIKPYYTKEEEEKIEEKLHPLVYGDVLLRFMDVLYKWIKGHTHDYANKPQNPDDQSFKDLKDWFDKEKKYLNSKNVFAGGDTPRDYYNNIEKSSSEGKLDKPADPNTDNQTTQSGLEGAINRINQLIQRSDTEETPKLKVNSSKLEDENGNHLVEFEVINPITNESVFSLSGQGTTLPEAYASASEGILGKLLEVNIPLSQIPKLIPSITNLGNDN